MTTTQPAIEPTAQIELGYNLATYFREDAEELDLILEQLSNPCGILTIARNSSDLERIGNTDPYLLIFTCEDAHAWGTISTFKTLQDAQNWMQYAWAGLNV